MIRLHSATYPVSAESHFLRILASTGVFIFLTLHIYSQASESLPTTLIEPLSPAIMHTGQIHRYTFWLECRETAKTRAPARVSVKYPSGAQCLPYTDVFLLEEKALTTESCTKRSAVSTFEASRQRWFIQRPGRNNSYGRYSDPVSHRNLKGVTHSSILETARCQQT